jgi:hypothetical protein
LNKCQAILGAIFLGAILWLAYTPFIAIRKGLDFVQYFYIFTKNGRYENCPGLLKKEAFTWSGDKQAIMLFAIQRSKLGFSKKK